MSKWFPDNETNIKQLVDNVVYKTLNNVTDNEFKKYIPDKIACKNIADDAIYKKYITDM